MEELQQVSQPAEIDPETLPVRKRYKKQYEEALTLIKVYLDQGYMKKEIAVFFNEKGYKTKQVVPGKPIMYPMSRMNRAGLPREKGWIQGHEQIKPAINEYCNNNLPKDKLSHEDLREILCQGARFLRIHFLFL